MHRAHTCGACGFDPVAVLVSREEWEVVLAGFLRGVLLMVLAIGCGSALVGVVALLRSVAR
jgi:uncharacterized ferredoxin-like protein